MQIRVQLMGTLKEKSPPQGGLEVPDGTTVAQLLERLQIDPRSVQVCTLNGRLVRDRNTPLHDGDELTVLPPVGGG
jgi:thiamine biosynthesis protein ThiS